MKWCPRKLHMPSCCRKKKEVEDKVEEVSLKVLDCELETLKSQSDLKLDSESIKVVADRLEKLGF